MAERRRGDCSDESRAPGFVCRPSISLCAQPLSGRFLSPFKQTVRYHNFILLLVFGVIQTIPVKLKCLCGSTQDRLASQSDCRSKKKKVCIHIFNCCSLSRARSARVHLKCFLPLNAIPSCLNVAFPLWPLEPGCLGSWRGSITPCSWLISRRKWLGSRASEIERGEREREVDFLLSAVLPLCDHAMHSFNQCLPFATKTQKWPQY